MAKYTNKYGALSSIQCIVSGLISAALFYLCWTRPIPEAMLPLDCIPAFVFMLIELKMSLCSNHVFMGLLCNVIVVVLLVNSGWTGNSSESHEFYREYLIKYEALQVQSARENEKERAVDNCEHCVDYMIECEEKAQKWSTEDYAREPEMDGWDSCNEDCEEKSTWDPRLAIVQILPVEELNRRCDDFIAYFRRQMSLQSCDN